MRIVVQYLWKRKLTDRNAEYWPGTRNCLKNGPISLNKTANDRQHKINVVDDFRSQTCVRYVQTKRNRKYGALRFGIRSMGRSHFFKIPNRAPSLRSELADVTTMDITWHCQEKNQSELFQLFRTNSRARDEKGKTCRLIRMGRIKTTDYLELTWYI